jgi:predicted nucleic acid-binding protein
MQSPPAWLEERAIARPPRPEIADLDPGETEAIELALELGAAILLIDEFKGRNIAIDLMLEVRGTLGILVQAAIDGLVDLESALDRLGTTNFRMTSTLRASAMQFHIKRQS